MGIYRRIDDGLLTCPAWEGAPLMAPLLWPFLIVSADVYGRLPASAAVLRARMLPYHTDHVSLAEVRDAVHFYEAAGMVTVYAVGGRDYLEITGWDKHQPDTVQRRKGRGMCPPPGGEVAQAVDMPSQVLAAFRVAAQRDAAPREVEQLEELVQHHGEREVIAILGRAPGKIKSVAYVRAALKQAPAAKPRPTAVVDDEPPAEVPRGISW